MDPATQGDVFAEMARWVALARAQTLGMRLSPAVSDHWQAFKQAHPDGLRVVQAKVRSAAAEAAAVASSRVAPLFGNDGNLNPTTNTTAAAVQHTLSATEYVAYAWARDLGAVLTGAQQAQMWQWEMDNRSMLDSAAATSESGFDRDPDGDGYGGGLLPEAPPSAAPTTSRLSDMSLPSELDQITAEDIARLRRHELAMSPGRRAQFDLFRQHGLYQTPRRRQQNHQQGANDFRAAATASSSRLLSQPQRGDLGDLLIDFHCDDDNDVDVGVEPEGARTPTPARRATVFTTEALAAALTSGNNMVERSTPWPVAPSLLPTQTQQDGTRKKAAGGGSGGLGARQRRDARRSSLRSQKSRQQQQYQHQQGQGHGPAQPASSSQHLDGLESPAAATADPASSPPKASAPVTLAAKRAGIQAEHAQLERIKQDAVARIVDVERRQRELMLDEVALLALSAGAGGEPVSGGGASSAVGVELEPGPGGEEAAAGTRPATAAKGKGKENAQACG